MRDFDAASCSIRVEISKSGKPRSIALTDEGVALFGRLAKGRGGDNLLLVRDDGEPWLAAHQARRMEAACSAASIAPVVSFHILRHTYGSRLTAHGSRLTARDARRSHGCNRAAARPC